MQKKQYHAPLTQTESIITTQVLLSSPTLGLGGNTSGLGTTPIIGQ